MKPLRFISACLIVLLVGLTIQASQRLYKTDPDILGLLNMADAVELLVDRIGGFVCTAFAIGPHAWLTVSHCSTGDPEENDLKGPIEEMGYTLRHPVLRIDDPGMPIPPEVNSSQGAAITIGDHAASLRVRDEKFALYWREYPVKIWFKIAPLPPAGGDKAFIFAALRFGDLHKLPYASTIQEIGYWRKGGDLAVAQPVFPGHSGSPVLVLSEKEFLVAGAINAQLISLYVVSYYGLPVIGTSESPFSLAFSIDKETISKWLEPEEPEAEDKMKFKNWDDLTEEQRELWGKVWRANEQYTRSLSIHEERLAWKLQFETAVLKIKLDSIPDKARAQELDWKQYILLSIEPIAS